MTVRLRLAVSTDAEEIADLFSTSFRLLTFLPPLHTRDEDRATFATSSCPNSGSLLP